MMHKRSRACLTSADEETSASKRFKSDIISELPQDILHHVMSFLVNETRSSSKTWNLVTTRILSKTWNVAWNSFPILEFDQLNFENNFTTSSKKKNVKRISSKKKVENFCAYVEKSISQHSKSDTNLQKFQLAIDLQGRDAVRVKDVCKWLEYAKAKNVRNLCFKCRKYSGYKDGWRYELPESLFCSKLEELDLLGCKFLEDGLKTTFLGSYLRKVSVAHVRANQLSLQTFFSNCCSLEKISIKHCSGFEILKLTGFKLEEVDLVLANNQNQTITIESPNPHRVYYGGRSWDSIRSSILGSKCMNLKELIVHDSPVESDIYKIVGLKFPSVEKVVLRRCGPDISIDDTVMPRKFELLIEED